MNWLLLQRFTVYGNSMVPTLKHGQDVLVRCWFYQPKAGDMVVIKKDGKEMIKRIQRVSGQKYFVVGDNKKESTDSRRFGLIDKSEIAGKVIFIR